jgi:hypothetical protein
MFERIGRAIDELIVKLCVMMRRTWLYRRPYATCWIGIYYWLHPEMFTKYSVNAFYRCGYLTDKQYKRYWDKLEQKWSE